MKDVYKEFMQMEIPDECNVTKENSKPKKDMDFDDNELIDFFWYIDKGIYNVFIFRKFTYYNTF